MTRFYTRSKENLNKNNVTLFKPSPCFPCPLFSTVYHRYICNGKTEKRGGDNW